MNNTSNSLRNKFNIVEWTHNFILQHAKPNGTYIDATAGRGGDTLFLCQLLNHPQKGPGLNSVSKVLAFDIQQDALDSTAKLLKEHNLLDSCTLIHDSHSNMNVYAQDDTVDVIMFNFGYLPGGNHHITTTAASSIKAINEGLDLLKSGGLMSLLIYSGGDSGFTERDALLSHLRTLNTKKYLVITNEFFNRPNNPPLPVFIFKLES